MKFAEYENHFKNNSRQHLHFNDEFRNDFINNGYEQFLFSNFEEEQYRIKQTEKIVKSIENTDAPKTISDLETQIAKYNSSYPFVLYFACEPKKKFYIAQKICEKADVFNLISNLYDDDNSLNYVACFNNNNLLEFLALQHITKNTGASLGLCGYKIYNTRIENVYRTCMYNNVHLLTKGELMHFYGNITRCDLAYDIVKSRNTIEQIISTGEFSDELHLYFSIREFMKPMQAQYNKMSHINSQYSREDIKEYCDNIFNDLKISKEIPVKWTHETQMFDLIVSYFPDARFQYYAGWLKPQNYDVYIPSIKTAFEFQGLQHYQIVDFFGGEDGYKRRQILDERKRARSKENNIALVEWKYDEPITKAMLDKKLKFNFL